MKSYVYIIRSTLYRMVTTVTVIVRLVCSINKALVIHAYGTVNFF